MSTHQQQSTYINTVTPLLVCWIFYKDKFKHTYSTENGDVVYVSRGNWLETLPKGETLLALTKLVVEKYNITSHKSIVEDEGATMPVFGDLSSDITLAMMDGLDYDDPQRELLLNRISQKDMFETLTQCYGYTPALASVAKPHTMRTMDLTA